MTAPCAIYSRHNGLLLRPATAEEAAAYYAQPRRPDMPAVHAEAFLMPVALDADTYVDTDTGPGMQHWPVRPNKEPRCG